MSKAYLFSIRLGVFVFFISLTAVQAHSGTVRVGFFRNSPHVITDEKGQAKGPAVDFFRSAAEKMGIETIQFNELPMTRLLIYLERGEIDTALILAKNPERAEKFVYPDKPFFKIRSAVAVAYANPLLEIKTADELLPLKIGVYANAFLSPIICDNRLKIIPIYETNINEHAFRMITHGMIDAFYSPDMYPLKVTLKKKEYESKIKILMLPEPGADIFTVFSKQSAAAYRKKYEAALEELHKIGSYEKLLEDYINK